MSTTGRRSHRARADTFTGDVSSEEKGLGLSLPQILGGALAAVTSALAASSLGVAGTLTGAFLGSLIATIGAAVYSQSLVRAGKRLRVVRPAGRTKGGAGASVDARAAKLLPGHKQDADALVFVSRRRPAARRWVRLTVGVASALGIALAAITALELVIGRPVSGATTSGTTIGDAVSGAARPDRSDVLPASTTTTTRTVTTPAATATVTEQTSPSATSRQFGATADTETSTGGATSAPRQDSATEPQPTP